MPTVTLIKPHTHAGKPYPAGAVITVSNEDASWLLGRGIIDPAPEPNPTVPSPKKRGASASTLNEGEISNG